MTRLKVILCLALGLVAFQVVTVDAVCRRCSPVTGAACLNETAFAICFDGSTVSTTHGVCPVGQVCTEQQGICKPKNANRATCDYCDRCISSFSCKSPTEFEFCDNTGLTGIVVKCPEGEYCNINYLVTNAKICVKSCLMEPSCYAEVPKPTYVDVCKGITVQGIYENVYDSTCKTYVYCEELNKDMNAILYTCASGYFNAVSKHCTADKPARCA